MARSANVLGPPQSPQREKASRDPNEGEGGEEQLIVDQEVNCQRDAENQQEPPVPAAVLRPVH
jgi:hypothetical protein